MTDEFLRRSSASSAPRSLTKALPSTASAPPLFLGEGISSASTRGVEPGGMGRACSGPFL